MDSNHRSREATDLQSVPFNHSGTYPFLSQKTSDNNMNYYTLLPVACQMFFIYFLRIQMGMSMKGSTGS